MCVRAIEERVSEQTVSESSLLLKNPIIFGKPIIIKGGRERFKDTMPSAFLAEIWKTRDTPAMNAEASQSCRRPAPHAIVFRRVVARRRAISREFSAGFS